MKEQQVLSGTFAEVINKVLKNSPCMCVYVVYDSLNNVKRVT